MDLSGKKIAVTGATGFLGQYIVKHLLRYNATVTAVVRNPDKVPALKKLGISFQKADLGDRQALTNSFRNIDAVVHCAASVTIKGKFEDIIASNVEGTEHVMEALTASGVKRMIYMSSASVYPLGRYGDVISEDHAIRAVSDKVTRLNVYAYSKARSEELVWNYASKHQLEVTSLRPFAIFGSFDQGTFTLWFKRLMSLPVTPYPVGLDVGLIYAGDIAEASCLALTNPASIGKAYNIAGIPLDAWEFAEIWQMAGGKSPCLKIPVPVPFKQVMSTQRLQRDLGWSTTPIYDACREIIATEKAGSHWPCQ
ncbi:MAG: NAD(P)-dependent oxidoreductase [Pseudomonadales bacterium]|nr:NAD(P)-dependent oxidoreductase [Pseudomonadales bacterium]